MRYYRGMKKTVFHHHGRLTDSHEIYSEIGKYDYIIYEKQNPGLKTYADYLATSGMKITRNIEITQEDRAAMADLFSEDKDVKKQRLANWNHAPFARRTTGDKPVDNSHDKKGV